MTLMDDTAEALPRDRTTAASGMGHDVSFPTTVTGIPMIRLCAHLKPLPDAIESANENMRCKFGPSLVSILRVRASAIA